MNESLVNLLLGLEAKTPSFAYPGGKAKIREWMLDFFPKEGRNYGEMFAGRGNVFWLASQNLNFRNWHLNDLNIGDFFEAIKNVNLNLFPDKIDRNLYDRLKDRESDLSKVLEPRITIFGKGYESGGYYGDYESNRRYKKNKETELLSLCRRILEKSKCVISKNQWFDLDWLDSWTSEDFVYVDPPYYGTEIGCYSNVNHNYLLERLLKSKTRWLISGYITGLYSSLLGPSSFVRKNHDMKSGQSGEKATKTEAIWKNY